MEALFCWPSLALQLTIATGNPIKVAEIEAMLGPLPLDVQRQPADLDVEETGSTYRENAELKASAAALRTGCWALADDSGLEVDALQGAPGLYSARYAEGNDAKVQRILKELVGSPYRSACFRSTMVLCDPSGNCRAAAEGLLGRTPECPGLRRRRIRIPALGAGSPLQLWRTECGSAQPPGQPRESGASSGTTAA